MNMIQFKHFACLLFLCILCVSSGESAKFSTLPICLNTDSKSTTAYKFKCEDPMTRIFITLVRYSAESKSRCLMPDSSTNSTSLSSIAPSSASSSNCAAYPTQDLADVCNGRPDCIVKLNQQSFKYGFKGSNCDFLAQILTIDYECIPAFFNDPSVPKFNICANKPIDNPILGFIHSPNYPNSYESSKYCQLLLKTGENVQRIEIFLIDMELEGLSKRTAALTDYLQVNNKEQLFGEKSFIVVYNDTKDAIITFRTDVFFNKKGFLLYFKVIKAVDAIVLEEEFETEPPVETTTVLAAKDIKPPLFIPKAVDNSAENESVEAKKLEDSAQTNKSSIKNIAVDAKSKPSQVGSDASRLSAQSANLPMAQDPTTTKAIVGLLVIVALLCFVIVFLVLNNRKKIFRESYSMYKSALPVDDSRMINQSQLEMGERLSICNASSIGFVQFHPVPQQSYKASSSARTSRDDSMTHLLLNYSGNYIQPIDSPLAKIPLVHAQKQKQAPEVYEELSQTPYYVAQQLHLQQLLAQRRIDIGDLNPEQIALLKKASVGTNEYCDDSLSSVPNQALKQNEYCYIPTAVFPSDPKPEESKARCSLFSANIDQSSSSDRKSSLETTTSSSNLSIPDSATTPPLNMKSMQPKTSTPSLPKTLPPPLVDNFKQQQHTLQTDENESQTILAQPVEESSSSNEYDVPDSTHVPNEYKKCQQVTSTDAPAESDSSTKIESVEASHEIKATSSDVIAEKTLTSDENTEQEPSQAAPATAATEDEYEYQIPSNILAK